MSFSFKDYPPKRVPVTMPLYHESPVEAMNRFRSLVNHWRRVDYAKAKVDDGPPRTGFFMRERLRKWTDFGYELAYIERENKKLVQLLLNVMKGPGLVDHYHKKKVTSGNAHVKYRRRMFELKKINKDNKKLLKNILNSKSQYDHIAMEIDYQYKIRGRKDRSWVYKLWDELANERRMFVLTGRIITPSRGPTTDYAALHAKFAETHRRCFPTYHQTIHPKPVPRSSRSPPGAKPTEHQRCFTAIPMLPPLSHRRRAPMQSAGNVQIHETKALKLRMEALQQKLESLEPKPFIIRSRSPSPNPRKPDGGKAGQGKADEGQADAGRDDANVNQSAATPILRLSSSLPDQSSPYARSIILDQLVPLGSTPASAKAASRQELRTKNDPSEQEVKRPSRLRPLSFSVREKSLADLERAVERASRVPETACSTAKVRSTSPGQSVKNAGKGGKKKEGVTRLPEIRNSSGNNTARPVYAAKPHGGDVGTFASELGSSRLHAYEQKIKRVPTLSSLSPSNKVGWPSLQKEVFRVMREASKSACITSSVRPAPRGKVTRDSGMDGMKKEVHTAESSADNSNNPTREFSSPRCMVARLDFGSEIEGTSSSDALSVACLAEAKFKKFYTLETDREQGVWLVDRSKSRTSDVRLAERSKSHNSDTQLVDRSKSQNSDVQLVDRSKYQNNDIQLLDRSKYQNSDIQVVERSKSQNSDIQLVDRSKSQNSDIQMVDRSKSQNNDIQLVDKSKSRTSDVRLVDRPEFQTTDVLESGFSHKDDMSAISACSTQSLYSQDDGGNTTDDAVNLPESDTEEVSADKLSQRQLVPEMQKDTDWQF